MNRRFGHFLSDLVAGGRVPHEVAELVRPVAGLVVGDRGDRAVHVHAVGSQVSPPLAVQDQALLAVDAGGGVEHGVAVGGIQADMPRFPGSARRDRRLRRRNAGRLERVDFLAELPVFPFQPVEPLHQDLERLGIGGRRTMEAAQTRSGQRHRSRRICRGERPDEAPLPGVPP